MAKLFLGTKESSPVVKETIYLPKEKFGLTIDNFVGNVDENGILSEPLPVTSFIADGIKKITANGFSKKFSNSQALEEISLPDLEELNGDYAFYQACYSCKKLENVNLNNLKSIIGLSCFSGAFEGCIAISSINFSNLEIIDGNNACENALLLCDKITNIRFDKLKTVNGSNVFKHFIQNCTGIRSISFDSLEKVTGTQVFFEFVRSCKNIEEILLPKLKEVSGPLVLQYIIDTCPTIRELNFPSLERISGPNTTLTGMVWGGTVKIDKITFPSLVFIENNSAFSGMISTAQISEIHFRQDMKSRIEELVGYDSKFGATNSTICFDL